MGYYDKTLEHHGILGQKWGVRRYQNPDGSLTSKGKKRYNNDGSLTDSEQKKLSKSIIKDYKKTNQATTDRISYKDRQVSNLRKNVSSNDYNELRSLGKKFKSLNTSFYDLSDEAADAFDVYDKKSKRSY